MSSKLALMLLFLPILIVLGMTTTSPNMTPLTPTPLTEHSQKPMDPAKVPVALHPLLPIVQRWGATASDDERYRVAEFADEEESRIAELEAYVRMWTSQQNAAYSNWAGQTQLTDSYELAKFYFLSLMLYEMEIQFPKSGRQRDYIREHIAELQTTAGIAAVANRMWAARYLGERREEARDAIPYLEKATHDSEPQVRAWAHAALALITGEREAHRRAIRKIRAEFRGEEIVGMSIDSALVELDKTDKQIDVGRLTSAGIVNDLATIRSMLKRVGADEPDHNNQCALGYAVNSGHLEAVRLLLEAGANPNRKDRNGNRSVLHDAAGQRNGAAIVELLLKYGADPKITNAAGETPLEIARHYKRKESARLLENAGG
jgi:hypothetical protein